MLFGSTLVHVGEVMSCQHEEGNRIDQFDVALIKYVAILGHVPNILLASITYTVASPSFGRASEGSKYQNKTIYHSQFHCSHIL